MLNALDHGWTKESVDTFNNLSMNDYAKGLGGTWNPWFNPVYPQKHDKQPSFSDLLRNVTPTVTKPPVPQNYLADHGEVVINGQRYIWNPEVDGWVVVLDLPSKTTQ